MTAKKHPKQWKFDVVHEDNMGKDFRDIPRTGGTYRISKDGVVVSQRHRCLSDKYWIVLKRQLSRNARPFNRVSLYFDGESKQKLSQISRLMLEAWVGSPPTPTSVAAHKNGKTDDDRLENLMWAEPKDVKNAQICRGTWAHGERAATARHSENQVIAARKIVNEYNVPVFLLAEALGISHPRVREWLTTSWDTDKWADLENPLTIS